MVSPTSDSNGPNRGGEVRIASSRRSPTPGDTAARRSTTTRSLTCAIWSNRRLRAGTVTRSTSSEPIRNRMPVGITMASTSAS